ncbi:MAG: hypothetical protein QS721_11240 [Candidatus Endonucleobacter sp. (ex Gigantidas childressi)]|nr:hypothetical protein [Candidatus Endonucleobacter sp. (ex Gigantidas childressi)]
MLAALAHPDHLLLVASWGFAYLPPSSNLKSFGLNENTNGLLRQYFPKNTGFKKVGQIEAKRALIRLNSRPRKDLNFKTPTLIMSEHRAALAA